MLNLLFFYCFLDVLDFKPFYLFQTFTLLQVRPLLLDIIKSFIPKLYSSCFFCGPKEFIEHCVNVFIVRFMTLSLMSLLAMRQRTTFMCLFAAIRLRLRSCRLHLTLFTFIRYCGSLEFLPKRAFYTNKLVCTLFLEVFFPECHEFFKPTYQISLESRNKLFLNLIVDLLPQFCVVFFGHAYRLKSQIAEVCSCD